MQIKIKNQHGGKRKGAGRTTDDPSVQFKLYLKKSTLDKYPDKKALRKKLRDCAEK